MDYLSRTHSQLRLFIAAVSLAAVGSAFAMTQNSVLPIPRTDAAFEGFGALDRVVNGDELSFRDESKNSISLLVEEVQEHAAGVRTIRGKVRGASLDDQYPTTFALSMAGGHLTGTITQLFRQAKITSLSNEAIRFEWSPRVVSRSSDDYAIAPIDKSNNVKSSQRKSYETCPAITSMPANKARLDILVVYTPEFLAGSGGTESGANARLGAVVAAANQIFADSNVAISLSLASTTQAVGSLAASSNSDLLNLLTNDIGEFIVSGTPSPSFAHVAAQRRLASADVVLLLRSNTETGAGGGIAWTNGTNRSSIRTALSYNPLMVAVASIHNSNSHSEILPHEIGHLLGLQHNRAQVVSNSSPTGFVIGTTDYSYGFVQCRDGSNGSNGQLPACAPTAQGYTVDGWGDIMSYFNTSDRYSSPNLNCKGLGFTGSGYGNLPPIGSCGIAAGAVGQSDNVRALNCVRFDAATRNGACPVDFSGDGVIDADNDVSVILRYLLGFRGQQLTPPSNAYATGEIQRYLDERFWDIDGDGEQNALTDGLLLYRLVRGFPDSSLLSGIKLPVTARWKTAAAIRAEFNAKCGTTY